MTLAPSSIRLVIFDWAGTTIDFGSCAPATAFRKVFQAHGIDVSSAEAREPMGMNKRQHLVAMLSNPEIATRWETTHKRPWTERDVDTLYKEFIPFQLQAIKETSQLVPGLLAVVAELRSQGIKIGGTTGYFREAADAVAQSAAIAGFVPDINLCADDVPEGRPAPLMIQRIMQELGISEASSVIKIGDTVADIQAGLNAGCWSVGVADSSSITGLSLEQYQALSDEDRTNLLQQSEATFQAAGSHAVIESLTALPKLIETLNQRLIDQKTGVASL